jgi:UPF0042 nucleotide-binding protein
VVYLDASDQVLVQRYKETRRKHPLASEDSPLSGIQMERELLQKLKERSDLILDTSSLKPLELKDKVKNYIGETTSEMMVNVMSFGFKYGIPLDADLVFDVRFLPNPHYIDTLRPKTGIDHEVASYVFNSEQTKQYIDYLVPLLNFSIPQYKEEGKQQLVIAIGCTGGKHRSVAITEKLGSIFGEQYSTRVSHRDMNKDGG